MSLTTRPHAFVLSSGVVRGEDSCCGDRRYVRLRGEGGGEEGTCLR